MQEAVHRRLEQELGMTSELSYIYKFQYHAQFDEQGAEHELCSVYLGKTTDSVKENVNEIAAWRYVSPAQLDKELAENPKQFTPWFKMEWEALKSNHREALERYCDLETR